MRASQSKCDDISDSLRFFDLLNLYLNLKRFSFCPTFFFYVLSIIHILLCLCVRVCMCACVYVRTHYWVGELPCNWRLSTQLMMAPACWECWLQFPLVICHFVHICIMFVPTFIFSPPVQGLALVESCNCCSRRWEFNFKNFCGSVRSFFNLFAVRRNWNWLKKEIKKKMWVK